MMLIDYLFEPFVVVAAAVSAVAFVDAVDAAVVVVVDGAGVGKLQSCAACYAIGVGFAATD